MLFQKKTFDMKYFSDEEAAFIIGETILFYNSPAGIKNTFSDWLPENVTISEIECF